MKIKQETIARVVLGMLFSLTLTLLILFCMFFSGCSKKTAQPIVKYVPVESKAETRIVHTERIDTVFIEIPSQSAERTTRDSTSHLETDYAVSDARINADGSLFHSLDNKEKPVPVPVKNTTDTVWRDNNIEVPVEIEVPKEVEKEVVKEVEKKLTKWQQAKMDVGGIVIWLASAVALGFVIVWLIKKFKK